jgi:heme exporter protein A
LGTVAEVLTMCCFFGVAWVHPCCIGMIRVGSYLFFRFVEDGGKSLYCFLTGNLTGIFMSEFSLSVHDLHCVRDERTLFNQLNFVLPAGQVLQVEGHNGSGKTSLLRILCGLSLPADGEVRWCGEDIQEDYTTYWGQLHYIGHAPGVKGELSPLENLAVARALSIAANDLPLDEALAQIGLRGFEDVPARTLSAGQQRRVALARLLVSYAPVWVLDEPFTALDKAGVRQVEAMLDTHAKQGGIAVLTSHHPVQCEHARHIYLGAH